MALKDWKKIGEYEWQRRAENLIILLERDVRFNTYIIVEKNINPVRKKDIFSSRDYAKALKFAKQYMRTH